MSSNCNGTGCVPSPKEKVALDSRHIPDAHLPFWEPGSGHYGSTLGQYSRAVVDDCKDLVLSFVDTIPVQKSSQFTVADFGTNDGYSSMNLIESIIQRVKQKRDDRFPVQVIYEDQEKNDFNSLFNRLSDKTSYLARLPHVYPLATNIGFYRQCIPDGSCDLSFTSMTTHWLDSLDTTFEHCIFPTSLKSDRDADALLKVRQAAERDWATFLLHRARELKPGGLLVVLSLSAFNDLRDGGSETAPSCQSITGKSAVYRQKIGGNDVRGDFEVIWKKMREDDKITQEEFESCMSPFDIRTAREITLPFETIASPVQEAGLSLVYHDQVVYPFFTKELWRERKAKDGIDDREFFARIMTSAHRTWSETTFRGSLSSMRTAAEKDAILSDLYASFESRMLTVDPEDYNTDYIISRLVVRKSALS